MNNALPQTYDHSSTTDHTPSLRYESEDDSTYIVSDGSATNLVVPKNRGLSEPPLGRSSSPLTPVFRLLLVAFLGLAPAGLGALVLAPLAALWALTLWITRPLGRADRIRVMVALAMAAGLLGVAIPMSRLFLARIS